MRIRGNTNQLGFFHNIPLNNSYDLCLIVRDNIHTKIPYGFSFQPQKDDCDAAAAATLENPLVPPNFKNVSQKLSFYSLFVI